MRLVPINCVKEGCYLAKTMYDLEGRVLLTKGVRLTQKVVKKIEQNGIFSLYINDEYSDNEIEDIIKPELRQKAIRVVKQSFESLMRYAEVSAKTCSCQSRNISKSKREYLDNLYMIVEEIIEEILRKKDVLINLVDIKSMDNYTYEHSVNVIVLSLIVGLELNYDKDRLYNLAVGAMLHDIGKVFVPKDILLKNGRLTEREFDIIKGHPTKGYDYMKEEIGISAMSRIIILQHHERVDGTGYPEGIYGSKIHEFSKIVSIADVYDALTSDRPYRRGLPPNDAIEYIMGSADRYFDFDMVNAFLRRIVPYPVGTIVKLSDGNIAVVEEINREYPLRPKVMVVWGNGEPVSGEHIDLMDINNLVIQGVEYNVPDGDLYRKENAI